MTAPDNPKRETPKATSLPPKKQGFGLILLWSIMVFILAIVCFGSVYLVRQLEIQQVSVASVRAELEQQKAEVEVQQRIAADNLEKSIVEQQFAER